MTELIHKDLSERIIGLFYNIYNYLGYGFLEKVYENAFAVELKSSNIKFKTQQPIDVYYKSEKVGFFILLILLLKIRLLLNIKLLRVYALNMNINL